MYSLKLTQGAELAEGVAVDVRLPEQAARFSIGRDPSNQWPIPDRTLAISARHCEIVNTPNGPALRDVSTNGTFVNGSATRLSGSHLLRDGDRIALGPYQITVAGPKLAATPPVSSGVDVSLALGGSAPAGGASKPPAAAWRGGDPAAMLAQGVPSTARVGVTEILRNAPPMDESDVDVTRIRVAPPKGRESRDSRDRAEPPSTRPTPLQTPQAPPAPASPPAVPIALTEPMPLEVVPPPLARAAAPRPTAERPADSTATNAALLAHLAAGLGLPSAALAGRDAAEVAEQAGALARQAVVALMLLLQQQAQARRSIGSRAPAMSAVRDANPLRVATSPEAALSALLAPGADAQAALQRAATEIGAHQERLLAAFRGAALRMGQEMSPESLDAAVGGSDTAHAAQRWDLYQGLWQGLGLAPGQAWSQGFVEAALLHLAAAYDEPGKG